jgi:hypothetical protein
VAGQSLFAAQVAPHCPLTQLVVVAGGLQSVWHTVQVQPSSQVLAHVSRTVIVPTTPSGEYSTSLVPSQWSVYCSEQLLSGQVCALSHPAWHDSTLQACVYVLACSLQVSMSRHSLENPSEWSRVRGLLSGVFAQLSMVL